MGKIVYSHEKRHHIIGYILAKEFKDVTVEYSKEKEKGFLNYKSLTDLLRTIPALSLKSMEYLEGWKAGMAYPELMKILQTIEESEIDSLTNPQKTLLFYLLYSENIFVNLFRGNKLKDFPAVKNFYKEQQEIEAERIKEYEKEKKADTEKEKDQASFEIGLPEGYKVVTRFPPEPSGYLHIGHAKAALLNQYFAERYKGSLIVRMDDTNPSKEKEEFEETIMQDISLLGINQYRKTRTSNYFDQLIGLAKNLIEKSLAYCDNTPVEQMRAERDKGVPSKNREASVALNMEIFNKMISSTTCDEYCLRAKISTDDLNKAMRDPVIYRVNTTPHHHTGTRYRVYPTYDFACPIVDSIEGVTLALRTSEYRDRNAQYMWFISALDLKNRPIIWDFSRMNFKKTVLSKRNLKQLVDEHRVEGWDDPRMPTVRGIIRKGLTQDVLKEYIIMQGPSKNTVLLEWDKLWAMNARAVDKIAKKIHGIEKDNTVKIMLRAGLNGSAASQKETDRTVGEIVYVSASDLERVEVGEFITLMGLGSYKIVEISPSIVCVPDKILPKNTKVRLTWIPESPVEAEAVEFGDLIRVDKMEDCTINEVFNEESKSTERILCDERIQTAKKGDFIQIEKKGIYYVDSTDPLVLNLVPATKQKKKDHKR